MSNTLEQVEASASILLDQLIAEVQAEVQAGQLTSRQGEVKIAAYEIALIVIQAIVEGLRPREQAT